MSTIPPEERQERNPLGQLPIASAQSEANITCNNTDPKKKALLPNAKDVNTDTISNVNDLTTLMAQKLHLTDTHSHVAADEYNDNDDDDDFDEEGGTTTTTKTVDWKKENKEMDKMFDSQAAKQLRDLPPFEMPEGFQKHVKFFDHQKDGLRWLLQQETNAPPNPFVRKRQLKGGTVALYDRLTRGRIAKAHAPIKGSILADDMGLGKTVQTLGLVLSNPPTFGIGNNDPPLCTLIVCPKTVISNWINQIEDFVTPGQFLIETYNGTPKQRSKIIQQVVEDNTIDILLSTYETIAAEFGKERPGLLSIHDTNVRFHRIVLDEAQQVRNPKSRSFQSIQALAERSEFRLALSGTPFVNKPEDIHSLLAFIGLQPLSDASAFKRYVSDPIKDRKRAGLTRLRAALAYVALRRTKNIVPGLNLADKDIKIVSVDFPEGEHKKIHDAMFFTAQAAFGASFNGKCSGEEGGNKANQAMFSLLLRVRQSCASGSLVSSAHFQAASEVMGTMTARDELTVEDGHRMIEHLQNAKSEKDDKKVERLKVQGHSPKILELLSIIEKMDRDEKGVIFSQWTSFLDLLEIALEGAGHTYTRIDGSMKSEERTAAMRNLTHDAVPGTRFILCSLKAAGVGINLTRANVCFMMDPWWNASSENQAIDRVHRMGQTRPVRVYRFVMKDTIEERMLNVQRAKSALGKGTMVKLSAAEESLAKVTSLKDLFQIKSGLDDDAIDTKSNDWY